MSVTVRIPTILRTYTGGASELTVSPAEDSLAAVIEALEVAAPGIRARVLDDAGALRRFVNIYVDDDDVRFTDGLATPTPAGAKISIIPAVAGG
jgi:sulfur-carrier protein